jgi:tRNA-specific 2-thiouridylase
MQKTKTIFVGLSGGVDSSVSAALLQEEGHIVVGVYIKPWQPAWTPCTWREERLDAMRVAAVLGIPFHTLDLSGVYKREVAEYMLAEYKIGRTPNPDIMCNRKVKFDAFWAWAQAQGADAIATGHYARIKETLTNKRELLRGVDASKDQSYFLWTLTQDDLAHTYFPIGELEKTEVRKRAEHYALPTAQKKDSQGICFLGEVDMKEFLGHYIEKEQGDVLNTASEVIGTHDGAHLYTLGERRNFEVHAQSPEQKPLFVIAKDIEANTITVAEKALDGSLPNAVLEISISETHWVISPLEKETTLTAQFRYQQKPQLCSIQDISDTTATVIFEEPQSSVASGQSLVVYDGAVCLGGGVVA